MTGEIFRTTARIVAGASTDVLLALARERAPDPSIFEERQPFFWLSEISNDQMDSYFGYMDAATTLPNFAADAAEGRAILAGHNSRVLPFGYSLTGTLDRAEGRTRVLSDAYTLRGLDLGGVNTDSFVDGARAGVMRDVSVGFTMGESGWHRCNVCGNDLMSYSQCPHWPGYTYEVQGEDRVVRQVLATFTVIDARLSEYSVVYDGATPSAGILKIQDAARSGSLDDRARALLEQRYRIRLPERRMVVPGAAIQEAGAVSAGSTPEEPMDLAAQLRGRLTLAEDAPEDAILTAVDRVIEAGRDVARIATETADRVRADLGLAADADPAVELPRIRQQAADGVAYREALTAEALTEAVRALGAEAHERYADMVAALPIASIRTMRDDWKAQADRALPGGRLTVDRAETEKKSTAPAVPARAYQA